MTARELLAHWDCASVVLITVDALPDLPPDLSARDGVYVLAGIPITGEDWTAIAQSPAMVAVQLPTGEDWFREEIAAVAAGQRSPTVVMPA